MKDRSRLYKTFLVLCAALGIVLSGFMQQRLDRARGDLGLTRLAPLENAPPVLAFTTVALGGFRGLIANALWVRAVELQDAGKYFEMVQLADWITKLQPHIPTVWIAQAWNMSYNISIKFQNPADRWLWVERGITLLRDQALKYNPQESNLYRELAWHFQHKIGANLDDAHKYYKQLWIEKMSEVLGGGRPNWAELTNPTTPEAAARLKTLREVYKMDPAIMKEADDAYGPLDWRMPETQAIYWAWIGLSKSKNEELIKLRRVIYQSMQLAFQRGRLVESRMGNIAFAPNLDIIPHVSKAYEDMMVQDPEQAKQIRTGHKNFLRDAVYFLYCHNRVAEANRWYAYLGEKYPTDALWDKPGATPLNTTMENYALDRLEEDVGDTSVDRTSAILDGLYRNYYESLAMGFDERAENFRRMTVKIHERFTRKIAGSASETRVALASLDTIRREVLGMMLGTNSPYSAEFQNQLRTELRLPITATNLPPAAIVTTNTPAAATNAPAAK